MKMRLLHENGCTKLGPFIPTSVSERASRRCLRKSIKEGKHSGILFLTKEVQVSKEEVSIQLISSAPERLFRTTRQLCSAAENQQVEFSFFKKLVRKSRQQNPVLLGEGRGVKFCYLSWLALRPKKSLNKCPFSARYDDVTVRDPKHLTDPFIICKEWGSKMSRLQNLQNYLGQSRRNKTVRNSSGT